MGITDQLAEKLRARRDELNLTQREAAEIVGVSERTWQNWEASESFPRAKHRRALDTFLSSELEAA